MTFEEIIQHMSGPEARAVTGSSANSFIEETVVMPALCGLPRIIRAFVRAPS